jgi:hypothetical protein
LCPRISTRMAERNGKNATTSNPVLSRDKSGAPVPFLASFLTPRWRGMDSKTQFRDALATAISVGAFIRR